MQHHYVGPHYRGDRFFFGAPFAAGLLGGFAGGLLGTAFFRPRPFYPYPYPYPYPYYPPAYGYGYPGY
jgi:hypothetical protein